MEVRGRSGVYVALQEQRDGEMLPETTRWMAGVVLEAWRRMIHIPDFPDFVRRCTVAVPVRCALIESVENAARAYSVELGSGLGSDVHSVPLDPAQTQDSGEWLLGEIEDHNKLLREGRPRSWRSR